MMLKQTLCQGNASRESRKSSGICCHDFFFPTRVDYRVTVILYATFCPRRTRCKTFIFTFEFLLWHAKSPSCDMHEIYALHVLKISQYKEVISTMQRSIEISSRDSQDIAGDKRSQSQDLTPGSTPTKTGWSVRPSQQLILTLFMTKIYDIRHAIYDLTITAKPGFRPAL